MLDNVDSLERTPPQESTLLKDPPVTKESLEWSNEDYVPRLDEFDDETKKLAQLVIYVRNPSPI